MATLQFIHLTITPQAIIVVIVIVVNAPVI